MLLGNTHNNKNIQEAWLKALQLMCKSLRRWSTNSTHLHTTQVCMNLLPPKQITDHKDIHHESLPIKKATFELLLWHVTSKHPTSTISKHLYPFAFANLENNISHPTISNHSSPPSSQSFNSLWKAVCNKTWIPSFLRRSSGETALSTITWESNGNVSVFSSSHRGCSWWATVDDRRFVPP